jgi:hypothetical protein
MREKSIKEKEREGGRGGAVEKEEEEGEGERGRRVGKVGSGFLGLGCFFLYFFFRFN